MTKEITRNGLETFFRNIQLEILKVNKQLNE